MAAVKQRLTPTLFDKLVADVDMAGLRADDSNTPVIARENFRFYTVPQLERFNEVALRATVRRELAWLLNTTNFGATHDLERYPRIQTSVLNYGLPDLAGKTLGRRSVLQRAKEIRTAVRDFEPRIEASSLTVDTVEHEEHRHQVTFVISGDITAAAQAMPVKFHTHVDPDTASVDVEE
ncbi:type VI secretion system baseplate subunit TssE [Sphingomonas bacterium]|uniref:type VI secretion system baseplate subunit TssE n=1 Tax=Sphingomonas bacterium TaxID=1895847 RepID=UPI0020C66F58|nr:type VI secretion system baseplate subunit TssE [Sphingomonas bacterium]